jgi:hypothetical protein
MPEFLQPEPLGDLERILELRAQWVIPGRSAGESRWRFWMRTTEEFDQFALTWERWRDHLKVFFMLDRQGDFTLEQVIVSQLAPESDHVLIVPVGESFGGTDSLEGPPQASPLITWRSDFPGRSYRGRTYPGGRRLCPSGSLCPLREPNYEGYPCVGPARQRPRASGPPDPPRLQAGVRAVLPSDRLVSRGGCLHPLIGG